MNHHVAITLYTRTCSMEEELPRECTAAAWLRTLVTRAEVSRSRQSITTAHPTSNITAAEIVDNMLLASSILPADN